MSTSGNGEAQADDLGFFTDPPNGIEPSTYALRDQDGRSGDLRKSAPTSNPAKALRISHRYRPKFTPWTADEAKRFLKAARKDRWYALYSVALALGLRRGEALALRWVDVDLVGDRWQDHGLLFTTKIGTPIEPRNVNRHFEQLCERAAVRRIRVHDLRHSCATLLYDQGVPLERIQDVLGHSSPTVTKSIYVEATRRVQQDAVNRLGFLFDA